MNEFRKAMDVLGIGTVVDADVVKVFELIDCNRSGWLNLKVRVTVSNRKETRGLSFRVAI